jgi:hypothetical protein
MNQHPIQYLMDRPEPSELFLEARQMAGGQLQEQFRQFNNSPLPTRYKGFTWIKAELTYPSFDHLTFAFKNSIFSVLIELIDETGSSLTDNQKDRWTKACTVNNLIPCFFKIQCVAMNHGFDLNPMNDVWNLYDVEGNELVDPFELATEDPMEMSDWENRNFSIQVVRNHIEEKGHEVLSFCDLPEVNPQIWFRDSEEKISWVIVQYSTEKDVPKAESWKDFEQTSEQLLPFDGYFAGVQISSEKATLLRGEGMFINFKGLKQIYQSK